MRRDLLFAVMSAAFGAAPQVRPKVRLVEAPLFTKNLFGELGEIAGKELEVRSINERGDCLCLFQGRLGTKLVDVDHRDIVLPAMKKPDPKEAP